MRAITSLNWVIGVLAIVLALALPKGLEYMRELELVGIESTVAEIAKAEILYLARHNRYREFSTNRGDNESAFEDLGIDISGFEKSEKYPVFLYSAESGTEGQLVLTARTNPDLVLKDAARPRVYTLVLRDSSETLPEGEWKALSHLKPGLGLF